MYQRIETERLILKLLDKKSASLVLAFLEENRQDFTKYEAEKKEIYFTKYYQEYVVQNEYEAALKKAYLRYYLFEKDSEDKQIIGTVSVGQIRAFPYSSGVLGYKMAVNKKNQGFGTEAVRAMCRSAAEYLGLHRLEAYALEDNYASIRLLEKCGFQQEGKCIRNLNVNGQWRDHYLYGKILQDEN